MIKGKLTSKEMALKTIGSLRREMLNCNIFSVYDYDCLSMQDLLCKFFEKINQCIDVSNKTVVLVEWLVEQGLKQEVADQLNKWLIDGTLGAIINQGLLGDINRKVDDLYINVKNYGAKGDGVTDDTEPIRRAVADMDKGTLFFPKGTYILRDEVVFNRNDAVILGNNSIIKCVTPTAKFKALNIVKSFTMRDLQFISTYQAEFGVELRNIHHALLENVWIQGFNKDGLYVEGCFISTYNNVTSIENRRYGANFDSDSVDPSNNNIRINNCNFSKNGEWNLYCKAHFVWDINGLDAEQFDFIECNGERVITKGSINIESAKVVSIDGLYYEAYKRDPQANNFRNDYVGINLGTSDLTVENIRLENYLISNNNNSRNGVRLTKVRNMVFGTGVIKSCLKGIQNVDPNNTIEISMSCSMYSNGQDVDSDKKYFYQNKVHNMENVCGKVNINEDFIILHKTSQNEYFDRLLVYYLESTNNYAHHNMTLYIGNEEITIGILPSKTAPYIQVVPLKRYVLPNTDIKLKVEKNAEATGKLGVVLEKLKVY